MWRVLRWYSKGLSQRPLLFKTGTGMLMGGAGDLITQRGERALAEKKADLVSPQQVDWRRFASFTVFGALWTGPVNHYWLPIVNNMSSLGKKLFVQHAVFNPFFYLPVFFTWTGLSTGKSIEETVTYGQERFWTSYCSVIAFWIPITAVMFSRVPERLQSVSMGAISLLWNSILSFLANYDFAMHKDVE